MGERQRGVDRVMVMLLQRSSSLFIQNRVNAAATKEQHV